MYKKVKSQQATRQIFFCCTQKLASVGRSEGRSDVPWDLERGILQAGLRIEVSCPRGGGGEVEWSLQATTDIKCLCHSLPQNKERLQKNGSLEAFWN